MNEQQLNRLRVSIRQRQREKQRWARLEKSRLYWIFDPRLHETHRTDVRETKQDHRRMRWRYFFSWEGLSRFLLAPVFKVGLTSIIITPFIANAYISLQAAFGSFFGYKFPLQMGLLFLSGLLVVIVRIVYELSCPKLVKAHINCSPIDTQSLQSKQWLQLELEYCLLRYVVSEPLTEDYIRGKQIQEWHRRMEQSTGEKVNDPPLDSSLVPELARPEFAWQRDGFDVYGVWLIENLLLRISKEKEEKLFVRWGVPGKFDECKYPQEMWDANYTKIRHVIFTVASKYDAEKQEEVNEGDLLLELYEIKHNVFDDFPKGASTHDYFHGIHWLTELGANGVVKEFIAENQNYWNPLMRMLIAGLLLLSLLLLFPFLAIQTMIVGKAIYFSFLK